MTSPAITQGSAITGGPAQQGYSQGFPSPLGIEQYLGQPQLYGGQQQPWSTQQYGGFQQPYGQPQFPGQQFAGQYFPGQQGQVHQVVQSLVTQLLPVAHQVILPQVLASAMQQIPLHLQQFLAQQVGSQFGQQGWQPQFAMAGQGLFGRGI